MSESTNHLERQGTFYDVVTNAAYKAWHDYHNYLTFALPFISFRALTPFKADETIAMRLLEGSVFAAIAAGVEYGVTHQQLKDYSLSYLPIVSSFLYKQNPLDGNKAVSFTGALAGTGIAAYAWQINNLPLVTIPIVTYTACALIGVSKQVATGLSLTATAIDIFLDYKEHYASWGIVGGAIAHNMATKHPILQAIETKYKAVAVLGAAIAVNLASFEPVILDQLFTPNHFSESYNSITQLTDRDNFNLALQKNLISGANIQIGLGYFGNYLLIGKQGMDNKLFAIGKSDALQRVKVFNDFAYTSAMYIIKHIMPYMAVRLLSEALSAYNNKQIISIVEYELLENNLLIKDNFIKAAKSNYTVQSYLKDITTIADDLKIIQISIFELPKIVQLSDKINLVTSLGLGAIALGDVAITELFVFLAQLKQFYEDQRTKCDSEFDRVTAYDKENAITISQKEGLSNTRIEWSNLQQCKQSNLLLETLLSHLTNVGEFFYVDSMLYTGLHVLVGYLNMKEFIGINDLYLYTRVLESISGAILFKSKNIANNKKVESAVIRLNELAEFLNSSENSIAKISYQIDLNSDTLGIVGVDFTRGTQEQKAHLYIDELKLTIGNIYAVTGSNGSGKSSFTTLLKYVLDRIADPSFNVMSGNIVYPANSIMMIPQKDYISYNSSLLDLILYPNQKSKITSSEEDTIIELINGLQVFANSVGERDLYQIKDNWNNLSGGQKKKLFMIKPLIDCPKILIMDETFGPLDPKARSLLMNKIDNSCLNKSLIMIVWHQDNNEDGTSCVKETFFDYELHVQNETLVLGQVGVDCLH